MLISPSANVSRSRSEVRKVLKDAGLVWGEPVPACFCVPWSARRQYPPTFQRHPRSRKRLQFFEPICH